MRNVFKTIIIPLVLTGIAFSANAQQGFGTNTPDVSAVVDMKATNKGVLLPRVTLTGTADVATVPSAATNLLVINTATTGTSPNNVTPGFYYWNGTAWIRLCSNNDNIGWSSSGNAGTIAGTNFVGTTDAQDLVFMTNASERMRVTSTGSVGIGTTPNASAKVDVSSTTQGFLPPRMTAAQMAAIASPVEGLMVYNITQDCLAYYYGDGFTCVQKAPPVLGSSLAAFYNGWVSGSYTGTAATVTHASGEAFSTNTTCAAKSISVTGCGAATTVTGTSGNTYSLKEINGQCWIAENLREVPSAYSGYTATSWLATTPGDLGYWGYSNTTTPAGTAGWGAVEPTNSNGHEGLLYQWSAAMNGVTAERSQGVCPSGFHVPSDCEFMYLEHGLGMKISDQTLLGSYRGELSTEVVGTKLTKDGSYTTNPSGFSGLFAGCRLLNGAFNARGTTDYLWSSSVPDASNVYARLVGSSAGHRGVIRDSYGRSYAFSVRCLKD